MQILTNANTFYGKYPHKFTFHTTDESGEVKQRDPKEVERENRLKEICLNCTRKKCSGSDKCFARERKKYDQD